jgi:hypothetical protein
MTAPRRLAAACAALYAMAAVPDASAYCRSSTCEPDAFLGIQGAVCFPSEDTDCGTPLVWQRDCVGYTVQEDASDVIPLKTARKILAQSFATWESADCGGVGPGIHAVDMGTVECDRVEYEPRAGNANILMFRDYGWEENGYDKLALTTVNYDKETGEIWNADIEVNTTDYDFIQGDGGGEYDLLGVLTHEVGHFLGIAHTADIQATMFASYHEGMVDLGEDDILAICDIYPPRNIDEEACNPIPRHGFSPVCAPYQTEGQCSLSALDQPGSSGRAPLLPIAAVASALLLRRRKSRSSAMLPRHELRQQGRRRPLAGALP